MVGVIQYKVPYTSTVEEYLIASFSDIHAGSKALDKDLFERQVKWASHYADKVLLGGDYSDAISPKDRRFEWGTIDRELATPDEQYQWVIDTLAPLKGKIGGILKGNHDYSIEVQSGHDYVRDMSRELDAPVLGFSGFYRFSFHRGVHVSNFDIYAHHGQTSARTKGGKINKLQTMDRIFDADIYLMSHVHDIDDTRRITLTVDRNLNIKERHQYYALTGGFLKGYQNDVSNYVERGMYAPTSLGGVCLSLHMEKDLRDNVRIYDIPVENYVIKPQTVHRMEEVQR